MPAAKSSSVSPRVRNEVDEVASTVLTASRALMGIAVRSIAAVEDEVTLVQYRALVLLASRGDQNVSDLAEALGVHPSTATRLCDRLVAKDLVERATSAESRREIVLTVTPAGRAIVRTVSARRRKEVTRIVERLPRDERQRLRAVLRVFAEAAGEAEFPTTPGSSAGRHDGRRGVGAVLHTRLCDLFGVEYPVLNAPMGGGDATARLAVAVSEAGGLGMIGGTTIGGDGMAGLADPDRA